MNTGNVIFTALIIVGCLALGLITGAIAQRKGRSYWGWSIGPLLISFVISVVFIVIVSKTNDPLLMLKGLAVPIVYTYPVVWIGALISVLIAGKTKAKRMQEIQEEEYMRQRTRRGE